MPTFFHDAILVQLGPPSVATGNLRQVDGTIVDVGADVSAEPGDEIVDCDQTVLMPGLVNGHTHLYSALAAGMPAPPRKPQNFQELLQLVWWRLDRAHSLESVQCSGAIGALAALRCGTTTLIDHHASPSAIDGSLSALQAGIGQIGNRGLLCYEVTDRNGPAEATQGLKENERYALNCQQENSGQFAALVGGHASFTMEEDSLAACVDLAHRLKTGIHIHVAEDPIDEQISRQRYGGGLLQRFKRHGLLQVAQTVLAHGTHLSADDFAELNDLQVQLAHNPNSNMNNGVGYTPVARFTGPTLLGTDGIGADMWREARTAQFKSHDAHRALPMEKPLAMLAESARFASRSLGVPLGRLEAGAAADLVLTCYRPPTPLAAENLAAHFIYAMGPELVRDVMIDGHWCLRAGQVVCCDENALRSSAVEVARQLYQRMENFP
ncbi:MAG: amidohydrolase family protein [Pirellulales bacterium]